MIRSFYDYYKKQTHCVIKLCLFLRARNEFFFQKHGCTIKVACVYKQGNISGNNVSATMFPRVLFVPGNMF